MYSGRLLAARSVDRAVGRAPLLLLTAVEPRKMGVLF